ncbi:hypothetical protein [Geochorda subterranea]|uniref:Uncharacterized protein n=1 Tax=Geochorda subterranea TaxID=3109564 RepID=A0ABZ1BRW9_9FIRM|nr:hypothetical protein [Limnochorda sp. LNt]WRP15211.1 hypothetical protein VLY81_03305 [Limnochorda sp. LNt]
MPPRRRAEPWPVEIDGVTVPVWVEQGQVRIELPFDVDMVRLAQQLKEDGYFYAHHPERVDTQGWGPRFDEEGYYPYWIYREGRAGADAGTRPRTIFAFPPQEYVRPGLDDRPRRPRQLHKASPGATDAETAAELTVPARPVIGPRALQEMRRWLPYLRRAAASGQEETGPRPKASG